MPSTYRGEDAFKRYTETPRRDLQLPGLSFRHYAATHDDIMLPDMGKGGGPTGKEEAVAIIWYRQIIANLDAKKAIIDSKLPALPLQKKGDALLTLSSSLLP
ncbi:hypothetical protein N7466_009744 [Penicillium verhagenii]|uniref:uncharacterized protein n=1 Tax=Penicillium verhagenii TaxID=1562060 RepID=UPI0025455762|nr:uncharacterized protein N7466_009744 [Penicillium verhagenii]KAJ5921418.1 hypothetical protein N7466_009744 [Penicillium verhagenii]